MTCASMKWERGQKRHGRLTRADCSREHNVKGAVMPYRPLAASGPLLGRVGRRSLLTGASLLAIVSTAGLPASPAQAGNILVGNRLAAPSTNAAAAAIASAQQA